MSVKSLANKGPLKNVDWTKVALVGGGVIVGGVVIGWLIKKFDEPPKPSFGIKTEPQCSNYIITDHMALKSRLREAVAKASRIGTPDPFSITTGFISQKAVGGCSSYPSPARNPGEAKLFYDIFRMVTTILVEENKMSQVQRSTADAMAATWAISNGMPQPDVIIMDDETVTPTEEEFA